MKYQKLFPLLLAALQGGLLTGCGGSSDNNQVAFVSQQAQQQPQAAPVTNEQPRVTAFSGSGAGVAAAVEEFRQRLGAPNNGGGLPTKGGRREINWDGVPANQTNVNSFPGDFFNVNSTRGLLMSTPGTGLRTSDNNFSDIDASYSSQFANFSPTKTFAAIGSNIMDIQFNIPGSADAASVNGFGVVLSDVDNASSTSLEFFDADGNSLGVFTAPVRSDSVGLSFLGGQARPDTSIARVRLTLGNGNLVTGSLDVSGGGANDLVVADDFLYSEPVAIGRRVLKGSGNILGLVRAFQIGLGNPNNGAAAAAASGRREINWDGVPANQTNTNTFPGNFFNTNSTRGLVMSTTGTGFRTSDNNFSDVDPSYSNQFGNFSPIKTFAPVGSNVMDCNFFRAGTNTPAEIRGFGSVFSDVDLPDSTSLQFFSNGNPIATLFAPTRVANDSNSFLGVHFGPGVSSSQVRLTLGNGSLVTGRTDISAGGSNDLVIVDDFLYSEPR